MRPRWRSSSSRPGNFRSAVRILERAVEKGALERITIGLDTPTGTGVMPLGVIKTVAELSSWTGIDAAVVWPQPPETTRVWDLPAGSLEVGRAADIVLMDAPWGSLADDARGALAIGDIPGIAAVVTHGEARTLRSRNTPAAARSVIPTPALAHLASGGH